MNAAISIGMILVVFSLSWWEDEFQYILCFIFGILLIMIGVLG